LGKAVPGQAKFIPVRFYKTFAGAEPVRDWLKDLEREDRRVIGLDIATVQRSWPLGLPLCRSLGHDLWEVRCKLSSKRIARVVFFFFDGQLVLLSAFIKKTQKTPKDEIDLALKRLKEVSQWPR
jgi:phage-related protein